MSADLAPHVPTTDPIRPLWPRPALAAAGLVALALVASYAPNILDLAKTWNADPNYSHGFLVAPIALAILWQRRGELDPARLRPNVLGWAVVLAVLAGRIWLFGANELWLENATIPLTVAGLVLAFGGWHLLRWSAPAVAFLWLMLPLPPRINIMLAGPLQWLATWGSTALLQTTNLPVLADGNVIIVGGERLEVEKACNGLSMLLSFVTLITATVIMIRTRPRWERIVLLLSTIPIALISNILRIAATAWCYHKFGHAIGEKIVHDTAGWAMMPIALALVFLELKLLSWLVVEEEVRTGPAIVIPPAYTPARPIKKPIGPGKDPSARPADPDFE
jgi:exosortase